MKIYIMTDMEGCAGVLNFEEWEGPACRYYEHGKRLLTMEVNAAVEGLYEGGATEILVLDGHGAGGIDPELLDPRVDLMRGHDNPVYPWHVDKSFDGICYVGQHAKAGTPYSHLTHTQSCHYIDESINGISIGEFGEVALCGMELGVPTILACGENALAKEAEALTPGAVAVGNKQGLLPDGLDHLDYDAYRRAKLGAIHVSPQRAREAIRKGALEAAHRLKENRSSFKYPKMSPPYTRVIRLRKLRDDPPHTLKGTHPTSIIGVMNMRLERVENKA